MKKYSIDIESMDEWEGPFSDPKDIIRITKKLIRNGSMKSRNFRLITGVYGSTSLPCPHLRFPSHKSWCDNVSNWVGESQRYSDCKNTIVAMMKTHNIGATIWLIMESDYSLNKHNKWGEVE